MPTEPTVWEEYGPVSDEILGVYADPGWWNPHSSGVFTMLRIAHELRRARAVLAALGLPPDLTPEQAALYDAVPPRECSHCGRPTRASDLCDIMRECPACAAALNGEPDVPNSPG